MPGFWKNLDSKNYISGGTVTLGLDGLPPKHRVRTIMLQFSFTGTKNTADTASSDAITTLISNVRLGQYFNLGGLETFKLRHIMNGRVIEDVTALASGSTTFTNLLVTLEIPFRNPVSLGLEDGSIPTELLMGRTCEVTFANSTLLGGVGPITVTSGLVRSAVELVDETNVPMLKTIGYIDQASQTMRLSPGIYDYLFYSLPTGATLTSSDLGTVDLVADGIPILQNMRFDQLISAWNRGAATAAGSRGELQQAGALFVPLVWMDRQKGGILKQMAAEKDILLQITSGSQLSGRLVYSRINMKDQGTIGASAAVTGAPATATVYEPATASKTPLHSLKPGEPPSRKARLLYSALPGNLRDSPTPGNKAAGA
jgi:hypothetical protein